LFGRPSPRDDYLHTANAYPFSKFGDICLAQKRNPGYDLSDDKLIGDWAFQERKVKKRPLASGRDAGPNRRYATSDRTGEFSDFNRP
jgi:hypothetical protein